MNLQNPFIKAYSQKTWSTADDAIDFSKIKLEDFMPALDEGLKQAREAITQIKKNPQAATFENTILPFETCSELLDQTSLTYFNLFSAEASEQLQSLAKDISPKMAAFSSEINLDEELFARVQHVYQNEKSKLTSEQQMLLEKNYRSFIRNGARLQGEQKEQLKKIDQELSTLSPQFSEHVLKATNDFKMWLNTEEEMAGLPESFIEACAFEATQNNSPAQPAQGKYLITLHGPSLIPFLQYASRRDLREKLWRAYNSRAYKGSYDNSDLVLKTVQLKNQRSQLLGFKNFADYTLQERMAETPERVQQFLQELLAPSLKAAQKDIQEVRDFAKQKNPEITELKPWDYGYYSEKLKEEKYQFNEEELRPYFQLENVIAGAFEHARKLFGVTFKLLPNVPAYHPDVTTYEVSDEKTGDYIGLFYADFFPRPTKKSGAWMTAYREQGIFWQKTRRPHVSIVCNFTKPTPTKPSLISYDEVQTLFHEFGHALHGLLSQCQYRSLAGVNVYWDFVELPSQLMENWVRDKEGLDLFAKHYQTGEKIPAELVQKIKRSQNFQAGYGSLRQINFALLDMSWHMSATENIKDVDQFENQVLAPYRPFPKIDGTNTSCSFTHIFAGGYAAGYYSYKWAEVLDADAFEFFKEQGLYNQELGLKFRQHILSRGGTEHPAKLYEKFRGKKPDPKALLRRDGLLDEAQH